MAAFDPDQLEASLLQRSDDVLAGHRRGPAASSDVDHDSELLWSAVILENHDDGITQIRQRLFPGVPTAVAPDATDISVGTPDTVLVLPHRVGDVHRPAHGRQDTPRTSSRRRRALRLPDRRAGSVSPARSVVAGLQRPGRWPCCRRHLDLRRARPGAGCQASPETDGPTAGTTRGRTGSAGPLLAGAAVDGRPRSARPWWVPTSTPPVYGAPPYQDIAPERLASAVLSARTLRATSHDEKSDVDKPIREGMRWVVPLAGWPRRFPWLPTVAAGPWRG